jgi:hypothetical protein
MRGGQPCCASLEYEEMGSGHRMIPHFNEIRVWLLLSY